MFASALNGSIAARLDITAFIFIQIGIAGIEGSTLDYTTNPQNLSARFVSIQYKKLINKEANEQ